jgi:hypothetical protein
MMATLLFAVVILAAPAALVIVALVVLGSAVAGLVDANVDGLVRPQTP